MLNLLQTYWDWRNKPKTKFKTENGNIVECIAEDKWAICATVPGYYQDLKGGFKWTKGHVYFKDCLTTKRGIEDRCGKIIGLKETQEI